MISPPPRRASPRFLILPFNRVWAVVNFFPTFTIQADGKYRVGLCHGLSCFLKGSNKMEACLEKTLGVKKKEVTSDGIFSWEPMECLGACEQAPAAPGQRPPPGRGDGGFGREIEGTQMIGTPFLASNRC